VIVVFLETIVIPEDELSVLRPSEGE